eukprot:15472586-Alexandrium_andersonii.AAC.2
MLSPNMLKRFGRGVLLAFEAPPWVACLLRCVQLDAKRERQPFVQYRGLVAAAAGGAAAGAGRAPSLRGWRGHRPLPPEGWQEPLAGRRPRSPSHGGAVPPPPEQQRRRQQQ